MVASIEELREDQTVEILVLQTMDERFAQGEVHFARVWNMHQRKGRGFIQFLREDSYADTIETDFVQETEGVFGTWGMSFAIVR